MFSQTEMNTLVKKLNQQMFLLFPDQNMETILFGSYARNQAEEDSDIDVMILVDAPREEIAEKNGALEKWQQTFCWNMGKWSLQL